MMSGRGRLIVWAAAASVMTACALLPLATPTGWIMQALVLVAVQSSVGALARHLTPARPLTVLAQAAVSLLLLSWLFAGAQAIGGLLPGPGVFVQFGRLLTEGLLDVGQFAIPAPVTPGIRLLLVGGVLLIALTVDALAVTYGSAAPAGLPLLALYSIATGLSGSGGSWFVVSASGYLLLLLAEGKDRLSRWGRAFGSAKPGATTQTGGPPVASVRTGRRIGALALGVALIAPAALPSLSGGLLAGAGRGLGQSGGMISAVNPVVALQDQLSGPDNREVFTYKTNSADTSDMYLRFIALEQFNGAEWTSSERTLSNMPKVLPDPPGLQPGVTSRVVVSTVTADRNFGQLWLPLPYPATKVEIGGHWGYEPAGRSLLGLRGQTTQGVQYTVTSLDVQPTAAQLASAPSPDASFLEEYTQVPAALPADVARIAAEVTRGTTNQYQKAVALQRWFTSGLFTYSTSVNSGTGVDAITRFLKDKRGFCVHFAFTMAAMARILGIPARVAVGFTPGTARSDGSYSVGLKDAHAWPELYFEGVGWTRFEPTPYRGTTPGYTLDNTPPTSTGGTGLPPHGSGAVPTAGASASPTCNAKGQRQVDCAPPAQTSASGPTDHGIGSWKLTAIALLCALGLGVPLLPMLLRRRTRARRLEGRFGGRRAARPPAASWTLSDTEGSQGALPGEGQREVSGDLQALAAWRELIDTAWDYAVLPDESETPRQAVIRLVRDGGLDEQAGAAAQRVATAVEQALYAPLPRLPGAPGADVRQVRAGLHAAAGRLTRVRATVLPRSSIRVVWRLSQRWSSATQWWTTGLRRAGGVLRRPLRKTR
jgi:transglutaminase-like putative cysteine protease